MKALLGALLIVAAAAAPARAQGFSREVTSPPPPPQPDKPRRNFRIAFSLGQGLFTPPICSSCDRFWGHGLAVHLEIGWTIRPDLVLVLAERVAVLPFADDSAATMGGFSFDLLWFRTSRQYFRGGIGPGFRDIEEQYEMNSRGDLAGMATFGLGQDIGRKGSFGAHAEALFSAFFDSRVVSGLGIVLIGVSWN